MFIVLRILLISVVLISSLHAQAPNYQTSQYSIKDGLPSNECHDILQDSLGYIWIATDRGLVKFDGYTFKTYGINDGLEDISCLRMMQDRNGDIWIITLSRKIFIYRYKQDSFDIYKYQSIINQNEGLMGLNNFHIDADFNLYIEFPGIGFLIIDRNGSYILEREEKLKDYHFHYTRKYDNKLMLSHRNYIPNDDVYDKSITYKFGSGVQILKYKIIHNDLEIENIAYEQLQLYTNSSAFILDDGSSMINLHGMNYFIDNQKLIHERQGLAFSDLFYNNDGYLSTSLYDEGVKYFENKDAIMENTFTTILPSVSATRLLVDNNDNIWVTTLRNGIYSLRKNEVSQLELPDAFSSKNVTAIEVGPQGLYFVTNKKSLYLYENDNSKFLYNIEDVELTTIAQDTFNNRLVIASDNSFYLDSLHKRYNIPWDPNADEQIFNHQFASINKILFFDKDDFLVIGFNNFSLYSDLNSIQTYSSKKDVSVVRIHSAAKTSESTYLIGTLSGLQLLDNEELIEMESYPELLHNRINAIRSYKDTYLFGTQGNGLVMWDLKNQANPITKSDGLLSDVVEDLFIDREGDIYVMTKAGLSVVRKEDHKVHVENYTTFHGLPSNEVYDVTEYGDNIYIATSEGIGVLSGDKKYAPVQQVIIENILVNDEQRDDLGNLKHYENNIKIEYKTLDLTMASSIPYRYRVNEGTWNNTYSTYSIFSSLSADKYKFEVQSQNIDGVWSDSEIFKFNISLPWWRSYWFFSFIALVLVGGIAALYRNRIKAINNSNLIKQEISHLERSALQAQMNPHFVFNCLNSIQSFIMTNQKDLAMDYLSRFAKLIRQNLNASTEDSLTLNIETSMLENYLELEKMRFHNSFDYHIKLENIGSPQKLSIPPMVIQPYVENAILHGMKDKKGDGFIEIMFIKENDYLHVKIIDNGEGIKAPKNSKRKSLGMSITEKRLSHLAKQTGNTYKVNTSSSKDGTTIDITIRIRGSV